MRILLAQMSEERETSQREIERDCEMTMMAFLLNSDGGITHSIMVVNSGLPSSPTQSFYPHPLHSDCGISNMSKISSSSAFFYNFRMTLHGDKGCVDEAISERQEMHCPVCQLYQLCQPYSLCQPTNSANCAIFAICANCANSVSTVPIVPIVPTAFQCHTLNIALKKGVPHQPPDGETCIGCKFDHQMALCALVVKLATRWRYLHWL